MYRSILKKYQGDPEGLAAWIWILAGTRYQSDGDLERGEVRISTRALARQMGWTRPKAQRFIRRLLRGGEIRSANRSPSRSPQARPFYVVRYRELQPAGAGSDPLPDPPPDPLYKKEQEGGKENGAAENPKGFGVSDVPAAPLATKRTQPKKTHTLQEQRDFLSKEIREGEGE